MVGPADSKRLPRGVADETIMAVLNAAKQDGIGDLSLSELQGQTQLARATLYEALRRLAKDGKVETFKTMDDETGRTQVRIALPE